MLASGAPHVDAPHHGGQPQRDREAAALRRHAADQGEGPLDEELRDEARPRRADGADGVEPNAHAGGRPRGGDRLLAVHNLRAADDLHDRAELSRPPLGPSVHHAHRSRSRGDCQSDAPRRLRPPLRRGARHSRLFDVAFGAARPHDVRHPPHAPRSRPSAHRRRSPLRRVAPQGRDIARSGADDHPHHDGLQGLRNAGERVQGGAAQRPVHGPARRRHGGAAGESDGAGDRDGQRPPHQARRAQGGRSALRPRRPPRGDAGRERGGLCEGRRGGKGAQPPRARAGADQRRGGEPVVRRGLFFYLPLRFTRIMLTI